MLAFLGPYVGPFVGALLRRADRVRRRRAAAQFLISRVSGLRTAGSMDEGHFGQLIVTLGISLILQNGGLILFGSTPQTVRTPLSSRAFEIGPIYGDATLFLNKARLVACAVAIIVAIGAVSAAGVHQARQGAARRGRQSDRGDLYGHRRRPRLSHCVRHRQRHHRDRRRPDGHVSRRSPRSSGFDYVIIMYSGVVLGGMGSILGAFWGGLTVGFVQQCSALVLPPQLQNAAIFVVFLLIVMLRPQGLFGRSAERA